MSFATYALPDTASGDTLDAQIFKVSREPSALPALASVECEFRPNNANNCNVVLRPTVTILNTTTWEIRLEKIAELELEPGYYVGSILFVDANGRRRNYLQMTLNIYNAPTR
jgi:hypothetical protein